MSIHMLGSPREDLFGIVYDFTTKLHNGAITPWEAKRFLRNESLWSGSERAKWRVWKTITLGTYSAIGLWQAVETIEKQQRTDGRTNNDLREVLNLLSQPSFVVNPTEKTIPLALVSVGQLSFVDGATLNDIYVRALEYGLALCPAEVGPQLRLQFTEATEEPQLIRIAMEPIKDSSDKPRIFGLLDRQHFLTALSGHSSNGNFFPTEARFVFVVPELVVSEEDEKLLDLLLTPTEKLNFMIRVHNALAVVKIRFVGDLVQREKQDLLKFRSWGNQSFANVQEELRKMGLRIGMKLPDNVKQEFEKRRKEYGV